MHTRLATGIGVLVAAALLPEAAYACEMCFGAAGDNPTVQAIAIAMMVLITMTSVVWGGIMLFFNNMEKRSKRLAAGELVVTDDGEVVPPALVSRAAYDATVNALLDKILRVGLRGLSRQERALLEQITALDAHTPSVSS